jgi:hypothetical protein
MRNLFEEEGEKGKERSLEVPPEFGQALRELFDAVDMALGKEGDGSEARQVAGNDVGTLVVQVGRSQICQA